MPELVDHVEFINFVQQQEAAMQTAIRNTPIESRKAILFIGATGDGKSTLINYLAGSEMMVKTHKLNGKKRGIMPIKCAEDTVQQDMKVAEIENTNSETDVPQCWIDNNTRIAYWDCPGFGDTRLSLEIVHAFHFPQLCEYYPKLKIVLVVDVNSILNSKTALFELLKELEARFPDVEQIKTGLSMVITKVSPEECSINDLVNRLESFYEQRFQDIQSKNSYTAQIIRALIEGGSGYQKKISLLYAPEKEDVNKIFPQESAVRDIKDMLARMVFSPITSKLAVLDYSDNKLIQGYVDKLKSSFTEELIKLQQAIIDRLNTNLNQDLNETSINNLEVTLQGMLQYIKEMEMVNLNIFNSSIDFFKSFQGFIECFKSTVGNYDLSELNIYVQYLNFFEINFKLSSNLINLSLFEAKPIISGITESILTSISYIREERHKPNNIAIKEGNYRSEEDQKIKRELLSLSSQVEEAKQNAKSALDKAKSAKDAANSAKDAANAAKDRANKEASMSAAGRYVETAKSEAEIATKSYDQATESYKQATEASSNMLTQKQLFDTADKAAKNNLEKAEKIFFKDILAKAKQLTDQIEKRELTTAQAESQLAEPISHLKTCISNANNELTKAKAAADAAERAANDVVNIGRKVKDFEDIARSACKEAEEAAIEAKRVANIQRQEAKSSPCPPPGNSSSPRDRPSTPPSTFFYFGKEKVGNPGRSVIGWPWQSIEVILKNNSDSKIRVQCLNPDDHNKGWHQESILERQETKQVNASELAINNRYPDVKIEFIHEDGRVMCERIVGASNFQGNKVYEVYGNYAHICREKASMKTTNKLTSV